MTSQELRILARSVKEALENDDTHIADNFLWKSCARSDLPELLLHIGALNLRYADFEWIVDTLREVFPLREKEDQ